jgi:fucose permease
VCNQKLLESVQYPIPLKEKILENQFSFALLMLSVLAVGCSIIEAGINVLYSFVIPSTSLLNIVNIFNNIGT